MTDSNTPAAVERLVKELRSQAELASLASRRMAEAKSLRQPDNPEGRSDLYSWPTPEQTLEGRAAEALAALSATPAPVSEPSGAGSGEDLFRAGWLAAERALGFEGEDESADACAIEWTEYLAALPPSKPDAVTIPEGMVPWHGGDSAPADWDGGPVALRDGRNSYSQLYPLEWGRPCGEHGADIIAYTPKSALSTSNDQAEVERLREDAARLDFLDQMNAAKNETHKTRYGWKYEVNHNRIALSDCHWPALPVRDAIDQARERNRNAARAALGEKR